jgi:hypothetical protein
MDIRNVGISDFAGNDLGYPGFMLFGKSLEQFLVGGYVYQYFIANSSKWKRRWFRRYPLDPVLIWRIIRNEARMKLARWRHKHYVRSR